MGSIGGQIEAARSTLEVGRPEGEARGEGFSAEGLPLLDRVLTDLVERWAGGTLVRAVVPDVGIGEIEEQDPQRPLIAEDVVENERKEVLFRPFPEQYSPPERPLGQI
jgi:hypothetical protein